MIGLFPSLPEEIYPVLQSYLLHDDYLCLVNSSKSDFYEIKRKTVYWKLSSKYSMMFLRNEKNFQKQINGIIADPTKQICINLELMKDLFFTELRVHRVNCFSNDYFVSPNSVLPYLQFVKEVRFGSTSMEDISTLSHLQSVTLFDCSGLIDISPLRDVAEVSLFDCQNLKDFNILGKQKKLLICSCHHLTDVSSFANITELSIVDCWLLQDISCLNKIPVLVIRRCPLISDLSSLLGSHKSLTIDTCHYELEGYEILRNIPTVDLDACNISDVSVLREAKSVKLRNCNDLVDVSPLAGVQRVDLYDCVKIVDIGTLAQVPDLLLSRLRGVTNANLLKNRCLMVEENIHSSINLLLATNAHCLSIGSFFDSTILTNFINLQCLSIISVKEDFSTEGLGDVSIVILRYCPELRDISGLGRNREVQLFSCPLIRDVSSLKSVPLVTIWGCEAIKDYSCLSNVPRLKIA